jgi:protease-4
MLSMLLFSCLTALPAYGQAKDAAKDADEEPKTLTAGVITIKGGIPEGNTPISAFGIDDGNLLGTIKRMKRAAKDKKLNAVVILLRNPAIGRGKVHELRTAIEELRSTGKQVWAQMEMATPADYLIACSCDKIIMPESGFMILPGTRAEVMFYRNLFDKLEIEPDMLQMGDFKGAAEPFMREKLSPEFRKQLDTVLSDFHAQMVEQIAAARGISESEVQDVIDKGLLTANDAKEAGLIDMIGYDEDWKSELVGGEDTELKLVEKYAKKQVDADFSGMAGFIRMMELFSGSKTTSKKSKQDKIAVVYAVGAITTGKSASSLMGGQTMGSDTMVEALQKAADDDKVAAIVLRVNSPGGSALASDLIWNKIRQIDKPVVCSMGDVAGSGGYYISMGCDKIFAEPNTLTGSIGVVSGKLALGKTMEKIGLTTDVISYGKNSGMFGINERFSDSERAVMRKMMEDTYEQFTSKAAAGRGMELEDLMKLAGGRVWSGRQAQENGLVDEIGTLDDAIAAAQALAKMDTDEQPELKILPEVKSFFEQLLEGDTVASPEIGVIQAAVQTQLKELPEPVRAQLAELAVLKRLLNERCLLLTPIRVPL